MSPPDLLNRLLELIEYENHLKKSQNDCETRWENVKELITFASEVVTDSSLEEEAIERSVYPNTVITNLIKFSPTPLRLFLQGSMLSSEGDNDKEDQKEVCYFLVFLYR
jgi:DNA helicase-2/ATP-dependent DNA helicase PcrA